MKVIDPSSRVLDGQFALSFRLLRSDRLAKPPPGGFFLFASAEIALRLLPGKCPGRPGWLYHCEAAARDAGGRPGECLRRWQGGGEAYGAPVRWVDAAACGRGVSAAGGSLRLSPRRLARIQGSVSRGDGAGRRGGRVSGRR